MARKLQHIAEASKVAAAKVAGEKVEMLCGARKYPMSEMDDSIPTCTKCSRESRRILSAPTVTWSLLATSTNTASGAA